MVLANANRKIGETHPSVSLDQRLALACGNGWPSKAPTGGGEARKKGIFILVWQYRICGVGVTVQAVELVFVSCSGRFEKQVGVVGMLMMVMMMICGLLPMYIRRPPPNPIPDAGLLAIGAVR